MVLWFTNFTSSLTLVQVGPDGGFLAGEAFANQGLASEMELFLYSLDQRNSLSMNKIVHEYLECKAKVKN